MITEKIKNRIEFLENLLFWEGKLSRKDLTSYFKISTPQATKDISLYLENASENIKYNNSSKQYVVTKEFDPILVNPNASDYLEELESVQPSKVGDLFSYGHVPCSYKIPSIKRNIQTEILKTLVKCIHGNFSLEVEYQSMNSSSPSVRKIVPCALGYDGKRWHVRVFSYKDNCFMDYVLSRIFSTGAIGDSLVDFNADFLWHTNVIFRIGPHPSLADGPKSSLEKEYGMINGELNLEVKAAFILYVKKQFCFDDNQMQREPKEQQLILLNMEEIEAQKALLTKMTEQELNKRNFIVASD